MPPSHSRSKPSSAHEKAIGAFVCRADKPRAQNTGPLRGIAVGIKDIIDTADFPTEMGSPIYRGFRPRADAPVVMMLKQAGATIVGKTTTTAFAANDPTRDAQSAQSRAYAGRIVVGLGGGGRGRHDSAGAGDADRRLGDPAGLVLRRRRDQAVVPAAADGRREMFFVDAGYGRAVRGRASKTWRRGLSAMTGRPELLLGAAIETPRIGIVTQEFAGAPEAAGAEALQFAAKAAERAGRVGARLALARHRRARRGASIRPCRISRRIRRWPGSTATNYDDMPPLLRGRLDESAGTTPADYDAARSVAQPRPQGVAKHLRRGRRVADVLRAGRAAEGTGLDRRSPFQPALDPDGRAVRQRSRATSRRVDCRSVCR